MPKRTDEKPIIRLDRREVLATLGALAPLVWAGCSSSGAGVEEAGDAGSSSARSSSSASRSRGASPSSEGGAPSSSSSAASSSSASSRATTAADAGDCAEVPDETGGPYPDIDGMIASTKYRRADITEGKKGTPLRLTLQVLDVSKGCAPIAGARVIIWHCDADGVYSEYASAMNGDPAQGESGSTTTTYLRGWLETGSTGTVTFTTIYPGWYTPRVTHIHVMVYNPSDLTAPVKTTQFAFPDATNAAVYAQASVYPKGQNSTTDATDQVFGAGDEHVLAAVTGSIASGYAASLPLGLTTY